MSLMLVALLTGAAAADSERPSALDSETVGAARVVSAPDAPLAFDPQAWAQVQQPTAGPARVVGDYSRGCLAGAVVLPEFGPGYQLMRPVRQRGYGHPASIAFVRNLAAAMHKLKVEPLLVGDLAQPRGGPAPSGHASHQTGLDVDLWYGHPPEAALRRLTVAERNEEPMPQVVDLASRTLTKGWQPRMAEVLRLAAQAADVDRIFVHPRIKKTLCETTSQAPTQDRAWLAKLRPWWGHHDHFHVRLACPSDSPDCQRQQPLSGDLGCDAKLDWWFTEDSSASLSRRKQSQPTAAERTLPAACRAILDAGFPSR